jgi:hypothetical protein
MRSTFSVTITYNSRLPDDSSGYVLSSVNSNTIIIYRPNSDVSQIDVQDLSGTYNVQWYNPREGGMLVTGTVSSITGGGAGLKVFGNAPGSNDRDWVVLLRKI